MKKLFAMILVVISLLSLSACGERKTTIEQQIFQIDVDWALALDHQEQIILKEIEYSDKYYKAKISGELFYNVDENPKLYKIVEQEVEFRQEHGTIWSTTISVEQLGKITLFAHRLGDGYISEKKYQFDDFTMTAIEYQSYRHINFLFYSSQTYLLYE